jgi:hypothetical protein
MIAAARNYVAEVWEAWNEFWFAPTSPSTLSAIRVLTGAMLLYTHLIWSKDLTAFFGPDGWLPAALVHEVHNAGNDPDGPGPELGHGRWMWTHFDWVQSPNLIWTVHIVAIVVFFSLMVGIFSRAAAVLAYLFAVSYANRITPGANFGLDKINCMLAMYVMLGPCGARYSIDRLWRMRRGAPNDVPPSTGANFAIRLIQLHMCVIYLFSGLGKLQGETWWTGDAVWYSVATLEYQSIDMTWLWHYPWLVNLLTHATVAFELSYPALIWPRLTRPWVLLMAVLVHGGIVLFLGMPTFGLVMLIGNLAFVSPKTVRKVFDPIARRISLAVVGKASRAGGGD